MTPGRMSVGLQLRAVICFLVGVGLGWYVGQQVNSVRKLRAELDDALVRALEVEEVHPFDDVWGTLLDRGLWAFEPALLQEW